MKTLFLPILFLSALLTGLQARVVPPEARTKTSLSLSTTVGASLDNMVELADGAVVTVGMTKSGFVMCRADPFVGEALHYWDYKIEFEGPPALNANDTVDKLFTTSTDYFMPKGLLVFRSDQDERSRKRTRRLRAQQKQQEQRQQ
ncbi:uncharacterized protein LOC143020866 isoform X2 [Oratosquilla oratoria]|uniref:uncharacterized protein LOC143020866 isoform X2 n=1 Tax=Oratosquilla oratoria TaxID=337810 RepID=UPI003F76A398